MNLLKPTKWPVVATLADLYNYSTTRFASNVMSSYADGSNTVTFASFRRNCEELSAMLSRYGVGAGDKVALLSENMPNWAAGMFAACAFGRVSVPILPDCSENEVNNILRHSEAKAVFTSPRQLPKISEEILGSLAIVIDITTLQPVHCGTEAETPAQTSCPQPDDMAAIIYTSGTSGKAKGVMLSHRNLCHNLVSSPPVYDACEDDVCLSVLPAAHTYEMSLGLLFPIYAGMKVCYLDKAPSPSVLIKAFKEVRPTMMCSVPLIIEKIYRKSIIPTIRKSATLNWMSKHTPWLMYKLVGMSLRKTFGGRMKIFAIGGAKLDSEVEAFLEKTGFPYAIGYGMTETAPLLCAATVGKTSVGSTGCAVKGVQVKLKDPDPATGEGEIIVKGPNVMMGYYKDPERTATMFTEDGWLRTSDLATMDYRGYFSIKGRLSNMILGASGENIYPEEIEMVINGVDGVDESLVLSDNGRLVALIKLNDDILRKLESNRDIGEKILSKVNRSVNKASQISSVRFVKEPFVKTATNKIRRFLYNGESGEENIMSCKSSVKI